MASFLCDLVKPCVEKLITWAIAETRQVFCFTCIVKEFEEERARLEPERITVQQRVKVANESGNDVQANVRPWEEEIDKLIEVDTKTEQRCFFGVCPDYIWRYKKGKELANYLKDIKRLLEKGETFVNIEVSRPHPGVERYSSKDYISFESRKSKYKELLDALKDDNNYITGLHGMAGTGKTTLAIEVGKELKQSGKFAYVVDTAVSFTPNVKKIQDEIAGSLGLKWKDCTESDRPKALWNRLTNGDKILVILDDVWDQGPRLDFEAIGIPTQDNHKCCKVLVTSRSIKTFDIMDCDKRIELGLLSEEDAWLMFKRYARISDSSPKKLIDKAHEIAIECKQLPVAISVIASSLKGRENREQEWDVTLQSLKQPVSMHGVKHDMVFIYNCLNISYENLKNEKAKELFLLCSVFREDEEYSIEVLTRLCIGVGLFGEDYGSYNDARNQVIVAKNKLVDSCLLLEVDEELLRMHDLVRDAAQWIAKKEIQCVNLFDKVQKSLVENQTNIKYLLCEGECMDIFNLKLDGSKLETLIVEVDGDKECECTEVPNSFFGNVIKLRVLYFSSNYHRSLSLPGSIRLLTNIRSISVDNVDLGDISILGNLETLETLDLDGCTINELPNQITKLRKFKLLKLEDCEITMNNPFDVIERCSTLEELYFIESFNDFCQEITLPELQTYHINRGNSSDLERSSRFPKYVGFYGDQRCQFSKGTLKYCMQTANALCLQQIMGEWRNLMPDIVPVDFGMNDLVELYLVWISQLWCLIDTTGCSQAPNVLSNLVVLELKKMENLEELSNGPLSFESLNNLESLSIMYCRRLRSLFKGKLNLCNLKSITIESCPMLVSLFEVSTCQSLVVLETLKISNCEGLKTIIADERREDEEIDDSGNNRSHGSVFSKLKAIAIERCHQLESIQSFLSGQDLPALEAIEIRECDGLEYVFELEQVSHISKLEKLSIKDCDHLRSLFKDKLNLCNLKSITIQGCPLLVFLFEVSTSQSLVLLEELEIDACEGLKTIVADERREDDEIDDGGSNRSHGTVFSKLKVIDIGRCRLLESILPSLSAQDLPVLEVIRISECGVLKYVFGQSQSQHTELVSLRRLVLSKLPNFNGIFEECYHLMYSCVKGSSSTSNTFSWWTNICCHTTIPLVDLPLDLGLEEIELYDLPMMTCLFVGPKNSFALKNLTSIKIVRCDKLKIAFSTSILRFLPELIHLMIEECKELEHIIEEDDLENKKNSRTCFAKLEGLVVMKCNKLKYVFPFSMCKELPKLNIMLITEAKELEKIFKSEDDQKVDIPNLNIVAFDMLPSLCCAQGNQFQTVKSRVVRNCEKLTLTSTSTTNINDEIDELRSTIDNEVYWCLWELFECESDIASVETVENDEIEQLPSAETTEDSDNNWDLESVENAGTEQLPNVENVPDLTILPTNSEKLLVEQPMDQQHSLGESDNIVKPSQVNKLEGSTSEKTTVANVPPIQVVTSNSDQVSLNEDAFMKVNSNVEEQFSRDDEITVSKSKPSPSITSIPSQFPSMSSKGNPSQKLEDLSSSLLVKSELEELVSKNHLDYENLSLLTEFLVENPSVRLKDTSLGNIYKGCAYNSLAKLLKFLKTHSLLEVSSSCHSEFLVLLQGVRDFSFDKEWLDGVERRALFPEIQVSPDPLEKLLDSKKQVTKDVEDLKHQLTSSEAELESIIQQEAVLSAPFGY